MDTRIVCVFQWWDLVFWGTKLPALDLMYEWLSIPLTAIFLNFQVKSVWHKSLIRLYLWFVDTIHPADFYIISIYPISLNKLSVNPKLCFRCYTAGSSLGPYGCKEDLLIIVHQCWNIHIYICSFVTSFSMLA